jgi:hypothetical protein
LPSRRPQNATETFETVQPGQVWWCDGVALGFEAHFKRRPVLVLSETAETLLVAPLSSRPHHGQERQVTHKGGISFLTGRALEVSPDALLAPLGVWDGFDNWRAEQQVAANAAVRAADWRTRLKRWFFGR